MAVVALLLPSAASAENSGSLTGTVSNGTASGSSVAGLEVQLHTLASDTGQELKEPASARVDGQGEFGFAGLDTSVRNAYVATAQYQGVNYVSEPIVFDQNQAARALELTVYEASPDPSILELRGHHLVIDPDAQRRVLKVLDISILQNKGDTTFIGTAVGASTETFRMLLPAGAREVELDENLRGGIREVPGGFAYTAPILPGQTELMSRYLVDYSSPSVTVTKTLPLPASAVDVLVADRGLAVTSPELTTQPSVDMGGQRYLHLTGKSGTTGKPITLQFSNLPGVVAPVVEDTSPWPALAGALLLGGCTFVIASRRRARARRAASPVKPTAAEEPDEDELLSE